MPTLPASFMCRNLSWYGSGVSFLQCGSLQSCLGLRTSILCRSHNRLCPSGSSELLCTIAVEQKAPLQLSGYYSRRFRATCRAGVSDKGSGNESVTSAYIHIPFCRRRCHYCDFPIVALGQNQGDTPYVDKTMADYVHVVCREINSTAKGRERQELKTVFFGGGTPSLLPPLLLSRILDCLEQNFGLASGAEVSMEMDPGTFDASSLKLLTDSGITRVSLGVQAFQESLLKKCGRSHGVQEVYEAIEVIQSSILKNWSLDLISSLPDQTMELWKHSLREAVQASPTHISVYDLQVETGTQFSRWYEAGKAPLPSDETSADFYRLASKTLTDAGFEHYEISNYAKPGFSCKHNQVYWLNLPYYAFGLGSTSYVDGIRFSRPRRLKSYSAFVEGLDASPALFLSPEDSLQDTFLDTVMLSFRLARGLDVQGLLSDHGLLPTLTMLRALLPFVKSGHVLVLDNFRQALSMESLSKLVHGHPTDALNNDSHQVRASFPVLSNLAYARLSDPEGFLFSNEIISSVFSAFPSRD